MTEESAPNEVEVPIPENMEGVRKLLKRYTVLTTRENDALADEQKVVDAARLLTLKVVDPLMREKRAILTALSVYFTTNRKSVLAKFSRTIELPEGTIKFRVIPKSLEVPRDTKPIIEWLLKLRGAKTKYLTVTYTLNKEALTQANARLLSRLHRRYPQFWAGRHENVSIKPLGEKDPITIARRRYPDRHH